MYHLGNKTMTSLARKFAPLFTVFLFLPGIASPAHAEPLDAQQIAKKFTPCVMLVLASASGKEGGSQGTGFVVSADGIVVTNYHVIKDLDEIAVKSSNGGIFPVTSVLATDPKGDIAILKIAGNNLQFLELETADPSAGSKVIIIGNPVGLESTVSEGIVSAEKRQIGGKEFFQISAPISHGSSGSPVFNAEGKVIGMASAGLEDGQALNFAVFSKNISALLAKAKEGKGSAVAKGDTEESPEAELYKPDPNAKGSTKDDAEMDSDPLLVKLANSNDNLGKVSLAKQLVKKYPDNPRAARVLSETYATAGMYEEAISAAHRAVDLDPESPYAWNLLGRALVFGHKNSGASDAALARALELGPDSIGILVNYSAFYQSNKTKAYNALVHAKTLLLESDAEHTTPVSISFFAPVVRGYMKYGQNQDAYDLAIAFLHKSTTNGPLYLAYADAAIATRQYTYVRPAVLKAIDLDPRLKRKGLITLSKCLHYQGDWSGALDVMKQAYVMDENDPDVLSDVIRFTCNKQRLEDADYLQLDRYFEKLETLDPNAAADLKKEVVSFLKNYR